MPEAGCWDCAPCEPPPEFPPEWPPPPDDPPWSTPWVGSKYCWSPALSANAAAGSSRAAAAAVWLGIGLHATRLTTEGERLARRPPQVFTPQEVDRVAHIFERARRHNPDIQPLIDEGALLFGHGRPKRGRQLLEEAVRREPENALAWSVLLFTVARSDPKRAAEARARLLALRPPLRSGR